MNAKARRHLRAAVVAVTVLVVSTLCISALARARQTPEELQTQCQSNLKQYALAILMYTQDYDEFYPPMKLPAQVQNRVFPYVKNRNVFTCPATNTSYLPNPALNYLTLGKVASPAMMVMLRDDKPHTSSNGQSTWNAAYADGHVKMLTVEPKLGKLAPMPPPPTIQQQIRALREQIAALDRQRAALQAHIRKLQAKERRRAR